MRRYQWLRRYDLAHYRLLHLLSPFPNLISFTHRWTHRGGERTRGARYLRPGLGRRRYQLLRVQCSGSSGQGDDGDGRVNHGSGGDMRSAPPPHLLFLPKASSDKVTTEMATSTTGPVATRGRCTAAGGEERGGHPRGSRPSSEHP